jgi:hypothetical protein
VVLGSCDYINILGGFLLGASSPCSSSSSFPSLGMNLCALV